MRSFGPRSNSPLGPAQRARSRCSANLRFSPPSTRTATTRTSTTPFPTNGAEPSDEAVTALIGAYVRRRCRPRLEYLTACAPALEQRLLERGSRSRDAYRSWSHAEQLATSAGPQGIELRVPRDGRRAVQAAQGDPEVPSRGIVARRRAALAGGAVAISPSRTARDTSSALAAERGSPCPTVPRVARAGGSPPCHCRCSGSRRHLGRRAGPRGRGRLRARCRARPGHRLGAAAHRPPRAP